MRILHLADLHLGIENYGRINPATGLHSRLHDYLDRLDEAIGIAITERVDLLLIAGDVYKIVRQIRPTSASLPGASTVSARLAFPSSF